MATSKTGETGETNNINKIERGFGGYIGGFAGAPPNGATEPVDNSRAPARRWSDDPWCNMTTGEADAWRIGVQDALFVAADVIDEACNGGVAGNMLIAVLERLKAGERMPAVGSENDWPMMRALFDIDIASMEPKP